MRKVLPFVLVFAFGVASGWLARTGRSKQPDRPPAPADYTGDVTVRRLDAVEPDRYLELRPYAVQVGGRSTLIAEPPPGAERWGVALDGGRVQISCARK